MKEKVFGQSIVLKRFHTFQKYMQTNYWELFSIANKALRSGTVDTPYWSKTWCGSLSVLTLSILRRYLLHKAFLEELDVLIWKLYSSLSKNVEWTSFGNRSCRWFKRFERKLNEHKVHFKRSSSGRLALYTWSKQAISFVFSNFFR